MKSESSDEEKQKCNSLAVRSTYTKSNYLEKYKHHKGAASTIYRAALAEGKTGIWKDAFNYKYRKPYDYDYDENEIVTISLPPTLSLSLSLSSSFFLSFFLSLPFLPLFVCLSFLISICVSLFQFALFCV